MNHEMSDTVFTLMATMRSLQTLPDTREKAIILYYICELLVREIEGLKQYYAIFQETKFIEEDGRL